MLKINARAWPVLNHWRAEAFLAAGVLLLASPTHIALELFIGVPVPAWLIALFVFPGLIATLVGLFGLYPLLADRAPRLTTVAGVSTAMAGLILSVLLGWIVGGSLLTAVSGMAVRMPPAIAFQSLSITLSLAFLLFGIAILWYAIPSRGVGILLVSFSLPWVSSLVATSIYGSAFPDWLAIVIYGPIPFLMLATGYLLRMELPPTGREAYSVDLSTG